MTKKMYVLTEIITVLVMIWLPASGASAAFVQCNPAVIGSCDLCALLATVQAVVNFLIMLGSVMLVLMTVLAGFQMYMTQGNPGKFSAAVGQIKNAVIGFVIVLAAWVIVNTVLHFFARPGSAVQFWSNISC